MVFFTLLFFIFLVHSKIVTPPGTVPFAAEGTFTGCWSATGGLDSPISISIFSSPLQNVVPDPTISLLIPLPPDPNPTVVSQDPHSLLIQMGDVAQLSRSQLCNGFTATPFPGTLYSPQLTQQQFAGFYGAHMKLAGFQDLLPECTPPGIPGIICDPSKAKITLTEIDVIVEENIISGYLTPPPKIGFPPTTVGLFSISNVPCTPMIYNSPSKNPLVVSIAGQVVDLYGFVIDPLTLPVQGGAIASGWYSKINGENVFYYYLASVLGGNRLPSQYIAVGTAKCVEGGSLTVVGGVTTGSATLPWPNRLDLGKVTISDPQTNTIITQTTPVDQVEIIPTGLIKAIIPISTCPRTLTVSWAAPFGLALPAGAAMTVKVAPFIR